MDRDRQEQTDVESLTGTLLSSSATELPFSGGSETEFEFDELIDELVDSQFSPVVKNEKEVQEWLSTNGDETQLVLTLVSQPPDHDFRSTFEKEDIEKTAAILVDAAKTRQFDASAWAEAETEQEVPSGDFKTNFIKEVKERPVLPLMNCIKMYCNESDSNMSEHLYMKILQCATRNAAGNPTEKPKPADIDSLKNFDGGYFSPMRLRFTKLPKNKRPLVKAVEKYVSEQIAEAAKGNNAVLFTRFAQIPEVIKKCNEQYGLNFSPEQVARYGIVLQKSVHQEIIYRCVDFLKYVGFSLVPDEVNEKEKINLSSNESVLSQGCSSQGSHNEESDACYSQSSGCSEVIIETPPNSQDGGNAADALYAQPNSPEYLRARMDGADSPGSSQQSLSLYDNQSPPQLSLPELEPVGGPLEQYDMQQQVEAVNDLEEYELLNLDIDQEMLQPENDFEGFQSSGGSSQSSYESGEPRPRRRRLE